MSAITMSMALYWRPKSDEVKKQILKESVNDRVRLSVKMLDTYFRDEKWRSRISVKNLDILSPTSCILGQLFASDAGEECFLAAYHRGLNMLDITSEQEETLAFNVNTTYDQVKLRRFEIELLKEAWRRVLSN